MSENKNTCGKCKYYTGDCTCAANPPVYCGGDASYLTSWKHPKILPTDCVCQLFEKRAEDEVQPPELARPVVINFSELRAVLEVGATSAMEHDTDMAEFRFNQALRVLDEMEDEIRGISK